MDVPTGRHLENLYKKIKELELRIIELEKNVESIGMRK